MINKPFVTGKSFSSWRAFATNSRSKENLVSSFITVLEQEFSALDVGLWLKATITVTVITKYQSETIVSETFIVIISKLTVIIIVIAITAVIVTIVARQTFSLRQQESEFYSLGSLYFRVPRQQDFRVIHFITCLETNSQPLRYSRQHSRYSIKHN